MILLNLFNKKKRNELHIKNTIRDSFDAQWYVATYNIDTSEIDPLDHFYKYGLSDLKNPNTTFNLDWYATEYPEVVAAGFNPFFHYIAFGKNEGRFQNIDEKYKALLQSNTLVTVEEETQIENIDKFEASRENKDQIHYLLGGNRGHEFDELDDSETQLLSFDIWDTVLRRKCHPDEIKLASARFLYVNYHDQILPAYQDIIALYKARIKSESISSMTNDYEYRYEEAINTWLPLVFETGIDQSSLNDIKKELLNHELKAETRSTTVDKGTKDFLEKNSIKQVIFASDFYMPKNFINQLLKAKNMDHYFVNGFVSCDLVKNKRSGDMFRYLMEKFSVDPNQILHIGDNKNADHRIPKDLGINTYLYQDDQEIELYNWFQEAFNERLEQKSIKHNEHILALLENLASNTTNNMAKHTNSLDVELAQIGIRMSTAVIGFVLSIIEKAKILNVDTVYFFTREGIFLKEIYDLVVKSDPFHCHYPKSELLEVSRLATFAPSLDEINEQSLMRLWNQYSTQSPQAFCASLNIDNQESCKAFEENNLAYDEKIEYPWKNMAFKNVLKSYQFRKIITETVDKQKVLIKQYFQQKGITSDTQNIHIVDLGWRGTIQDNVAHILDNPVHGSYLGLFGFLNQQPENSTKNGYLFDKNQEAEAWKSEEVGPLEMLCNALGGSTIGYELNASGTEIIAIKKTEEAEDTVFENYTKHFQHGIKNAIPELVDYIAVHGLVSKDIKNISRNLVKSLLKNPPGAIASAFFNLTHNETFGTGEYQKMHIDENFINTISKKSGSFLHSFIANFLQDIRWKEGFLNLKATANAISNIQTDLTNSPLEFYKKAVLHNKSNKFKVAIYSPEPIIGSGGHRTIFNLARKLIDAGCEVYCFIESEGQGVNVVHDYLDGKNAFVSVGWPDHMEFDLAIATIAYSAQFIAQLKKVKHRAYLVQDFEAWFNPVGDQYTINENSYTFGNLHFTVGKFLTHVLKHQYNAKAIPSGLGVDANVYFDKETPRENAICFLYQPEKSRRNPDLAIKALRIVKEKNPDISIYVYGSDAEIDLDFEVENLGLIRNLSELNDLYNKCKVGLCISMTNPSRIPFEFMSAGVVPVDIYRYNNLLDYPSGTLLLAYQSSDSIASAILQLFKDEDQFESRKAACKDFSHTRSLDWEMDTFVNCALSLMHDKEVDSVNVYSEYHEEPVIAEIDQRKEVYGFCHWQKQLAELK